MAGYRKAVAEKRLRGTGYPTEAQYLLNFFETIGLLVRRGYLDADDVWSSFGYWMFNVYADFREDIEQEQREDGSYYRDFCDLIEELTQIEMHAGGRDDHPSRDEILEFWRDESKLPIGTTPKRRRPRRAKTTIETNEQKGETSSEIS
jgi:hypothetical protein